ncbi:hypothetical protein RRG08_046865 [Elysia crispata]|uniref:Uncharacterized protein n=1 Tax=Elysia crispata TaxID=231223 RepID=A0AAE0ZI92_9GAST|nr:hypothetical protein RRG08_046865 [Elysia crispata]
MSTNPGSASSRETYFIVRSTLNHAICDNLSCRKALIDHRESFTESESDRLGADGEERFRHRDMKPCNKSRLPCATLKAGRRFNDSRCRDGAQ